MAYEESSSSASMAPCAAMIAETPQTDDPIASRSVSFGRKPNAFPSAVIKRRETVISMATRIRVTPPSFRMSPRMNREPSSTMPVLSQNS
jgi:hypothetical protein